MNINNIPAYLNDIVNIFIFILLCFLGISARLSYEVEIQNKHSSLKSFFNRFFITVALNYVIRSIILHNKTLKEYYSEITLIVAFFSIDIIRFFTENARTIIVYILNIFNKGFKDAIDSVNKTQKNKNNGIN